MREQIVRDEIDEAVDRDAEADWERERIKHGLFGKNYQSDGKRGESDCKHIVQFDEKPARRMMSLMNLPQNAVKQPAMNKI